MDWFNVRVKVLESQVQLVSVLYFLATYSCRPS